MVSAIRSILGMSRQVDMMISMVDLDGDGQVSYDEFRRLVIDPDPARADFGTAPLKSEVKEAEGVTQASPCFRGTVIPYIHYKLP